MDMAAPFEPNPTVPTLILRLANGRADVSPLTTARRALDDGQAAWLLGPDGSARLGVVRDLATTDAEAIYLPAVEPEAAERSLAGLRHVVHRLRAPGGCPWDREQTPETLARYVLEEAYEVVDAIE